MILNMEIKFSGPKGGVVIIDADDHELVSKYTWRLDDKG